MTVTKCVNVTEDNHVFLVFDMGLNPMINEATLPHTRFFATGPRSQVNIAKTSQAGPKHTVLLRFGMRSLP